MNRSIPEQRPAERLVDRFEAWVDRAPEAVALVAEGRETTYGELDARANRLAGFLVSRGVGPEVVVGVCGTTGADSVVALLGILKAEGVYLPLDIRNPRGRLEHMVRSSGAHLVLTGPAGPAAPVGAGDTEAFGPLTLRWEEHRADIDGRPATRPRRTVHPDALMYIVYTSGSTGTPKGIEVPHRTLGNAVGWLDAGAAGPSVCLQFASAGFDVSLLEVMGSLSSGSRLVIVEEDVRGEPALLLHLMARCGVERLYLSPSLLQQLAVAAGGLTEPLPAPGLSKLREILVSGEVLRLTPDVRGFLDSLDGVLLENQYGPSETHHATSLQLTGACADWPDNPTIGQPIDHVAIHILDDRLHPAPTGVPGEIYISGPGLARGYANNPTLTAQRFIANPHTSTPTRMYRTGDLARITPTGHLEFLGRTDTQIKIRGFRIEPAEIENALTTHPAIREAAITTHPTTTGTPQLTAYITPAPDSAIPPVEAIRQHLATQLPDHMIPTHYIHLDTLPLNTNGKLDRKNLPTPPPTRPHLTQAHTPPTTPHQHTIHAIWAHTLGIDTLGIHDNFFTLGGHSLTATQVATRITQTFKINCPVRTIFENPTIHQLARWAGDSQTEAPPGLLSGRAAADPGLLAFGQQRMWFLDQMVPDSTLYNTQALWRIDGDLDVPALQWALTDVVRRHAVLRSRIITDQSGPLQVIVPPAAVGLPLTDLSAHPLPEAMIRVHELSQEDAARPFDLAAGPLLRPRLFRVAADSHCLLVNFHHSVIDAWSLTVLWRELSALYDARLADRPSPLPELPFQYSDYAAHQHAWLSTGEAQEQLSYWETVLKGAPDVIDLPTDRPRPAAPSGAGGRVAFRVPAEVEAELRALARSHDATLFMVLLAAYGFLLSVYVRRSDVVVGVPAAGRTHPELEDLVGLFINSLPVRLAWEGNPTVSELLRITKEAGLEALRHQDVPFERMVDALADERHAGVNPLFQTWFDFDQSLAVDSPADIRVERVPVALHSTRFDLEMLLEERPDGLTGSFGYDADLFDAVSGERFVEHYLALLASFAHRTDTPAAVPAAPAMSLLVDAGRPTVDAFEDVLGEFEAWVDRAPEAVALVAEGRETTYGELDARANRLAGFLVSRGVGPEVVVGVCGTTGADSVVALLGILKAEGVYLPLDIRNPRGRLEHMVRSSGAHLVLTGPAAPVGAGDTEAFGPLTLRWEEHRADIDGRPATRPRRTVHPDALMYIVYTSGSTGTPKGIAVSLRTIGNLAAWKVGTGMRGRTCVQLSSAGFDVFLQEVFTTFASGGRLVLADDLDREDPGRLLELMARCGVERLYLSPSLLQQLAATAAVTGCVPPLREVVAGGEVLRLTPDVRGFLDSLDGVLLENQYGPSETHHATSLQLTGACADWPDNPTIGQPIDHVAIHILDDRLHPAPTGVPGEIYISGPGLARGYANNPTLTAQRFIANPHTSTPTRMYRTGDLARITPTGHLEFLGRTDTQIKIRGFRIEPAEIENALTTHPAIREAAITTHPTTTGTPQLTAYITPAPDSAIPPVEAIRQHLATQLPDHMIPTHYIHLDTLPLNTNGKLDRKNLPTPPPTRPHLTQAHTPPTTPHQHTIHAIWAHTLGIDTLGIHDNFFTLGGHSLTATQVATRITQTFKINCPVRTIFENPTIHQLAHEVEVLVTADVTGLPVDDVRGMLAARGTDTARPA